MDTTKLRMGEAVAAVAGLLFFIDLFFIKWYGASTGNVQSRLGIKIPNLPSIEVASVNGCTA